MSSEEELDNLLLIAEVPEAEIRMMSKREKQDYLRIIDESKLMIDDNDYVQIPKTNNVRPIDKRMTDKNPLGPSNRSNGGDNSVKNYRVSSAKKTEPNPINHDNGIREKRIHEDKVETASKILFDGIAKPARQYYRAENPQHAQMENKIDFRNLPNNDNINRKDRPMPKEISNIPIPDRIPRSAGLKAKQDSEKRKDVSHVVSNSKRVGVQQKSQLYLNGQEIHPPKKVEKDVSGSGHKSVIKNDEPIPSRKVVNDSIYEKPKPNPISQPVNNDRKDEKIVLGGGYKSTFKNDEPIPSRKVVNDSIYDKPNPISQPVNNDRKDEKIVLGGGHKSTFKNDEPIPSRKVVNDSIYEKPKPNPISQPVNNDRKDEKTVSGFKNNQMGKNDQTIPSRKATLDDTKSQFSNSDFRAKKDVHPDLEKENEIYRSKAFIPNNEPIKDIKKNIPQIPKQDNIEPKSVNNNSFVDRKPKENNTQPKTDSFFDPQYPIPKPINSKPDAPKSIVQIQDMEYESIIREEELKLVQARERENEGKRKENDDKRKKDMLLSSIKKIPIEDSTGITLKVMIERKSYTRKFKVDTKGNIVYLWVCKCLIDDEKEADPEMFELKGGASSDVVRKDVSLSEQGITKNSMLNYILL